METDPLIHDGELTHPAAKVLGQLLAGWLLFKAEHDLSSSEVIYVSATHHLFQLLQQFEDLLTKGPSWKPQ